MQAAAKACTASWPCSKPRRGVSSPMGDQRDVRDRVEDEETRSRTLSDAPLAILRRPASWNSRLPASMHTRPGNWGRSRCLAPMCLAPTANHHLLRIVRGPAFLMFGGHDARPLLTKRGYPQHRCKRRSFDPSAGPSVPTRRYQPSSLTWWLCGAVAGQLRKSVTRPEWMGLSFRRVTTRSEAVRYGFRPEHRRERTDHQCTRSAQ